MLIRKNEYLDLPRNKVRCLRNISLPKSTSLLVWSKWSMNKNYLELSIVLLRTDKNGNLKEQEVSLLELFSLESLPSGGPDFLSFFKSGNYLWGAIDMSLQQLVTKITHKLQIFFDSEVAVLGGVDPNEVVKFSLEIGYEVLEGESTVKKLKGFLLFKE